MKIGHQGGIHNLAQLQAWLRSPSSRTALCVSAIMYGAYAFAHGAWDNFVLIGLSLFTAGFLAMFANLSNAVYDWANSGAIEMTSAPVASALKQISEGAREVTIHVDAAQTQYRFTNQGGSLAPAH